MWSLTASTPAVFSAMTRMPWRSSSVVMVPHRSTTPSATVTLSVVVGAQGCASRAFRIAVRMLRSSVFSGSHMPNSPDQRAQQVRAADNTDDLAIGGYRQALDAVFLHGRDHILQPRVSRDAEHVLGHDIAHVTAIGAGEIGGLPGRGGKQAEPPGAVALGADFVAAQQVALGDDAREVTGLVDHEQTGDVPGQHKVDGFLYRRFGGDGNAVAGHDVGDDHWFCPFSGAWAGCPRRRKLSAKPCRFYSDWVVNIAAGQLGVDRQMVKLRCP